MACFGVHSQQSHLRASARRQNKTSLKKGFLYISVLSKTVPYIETEDFPSSQGFLWCFPKGLHFNEETAHIQIYAISLSLGQSKETSKGKGQGSVQLRFSVSQGRYGQPGWFPVSEGSRDEKQMQDLGWYPGAMRRRRDSEIWIDPQRGEGSRMWTSPWEEGKTGLGWKSEGQTETWTTHREKPSRNRNDI